jgi:hypothetical protein
MTDLVFKFQCGGHREAISIDQPEISVRDLRELAYNFFKNKVSCLSGIVKAFF